MMNDQTTFVTLDIDQFTRTEPSSHKTGKAAQTLAKEYAPILNLFNDVIFIVDQAGHFVFVNNASELRTGIPTKKFIGRHFLQLVDREYHEFAKVAFQKLLAGEKIPSVEMSRQTPSGENITVEVSWTTIYEDNVVVAILGVSRDVTDRKRAEEALKRAREELEMRVRGRTADLEKANEQLRLEIEERKGAEEALRESEEKFRTVSEQSPNMIFINKKGKVVYANRVCVEIMGYKREEFYSSDFDFLCLVAPESLDKLQTAYKRHMDGKEVEPYEYTLVNKEGKRIKAIITTKLMHYEGERSILGIVTDISEQKRVEDALRDSERRLRSLSSQLMKAQEKERMRLSKELHDELGQALALLKHRMRSIQSKLQKGQSSLHSECEETSRYIDEIIENVRRLSRDLSPSILEDLGLTSALQWLTESFGKQYSLMTSFDFDNIDDLFSKAAQTNLYRISQEALTNIGKHAEAKHVSFAVKENEGSVTLIIEDDGKGFEVNKVRSLHSPEKGLGLDAMEERAHMLGGSLAINSQVGEGTKITLTTPLEVVKE